VAAGAAADPPGGPAAAAFAAGPLRDLLGIVAAVESASGHGLGAAFTRAAREAGIAVPPPRDVHAEVGRGVAGTADGRAVLVGTAAFLEGRGVAIPPPAGPAAPSAGTTTVFAAVDGRFAGWFAIADPPRPEAAAAIARLQGDGLAVEMLSGDATTTVRHVAAAVGIERAQGGLAPEAKARRVEALREAARDRAAVVFVGDGINDAPALAAADVGVAMGSGADVALETADVTLLSGGLAAVPEAVALARRTMRVVRQNLALAFLYNVLAIPVAAGALYPLVGHVTSPMLAAAAMSLSSLSVIANSLRLRR
jgi:Cu+-exporting ATPase